VHVHVCWCVSLPRNRARLRCSIHVTLRTLRTLVPPSSCPSCSDMRCGLCFWRGKPTLVAPARMCWLPSCEGPACCSTGCDQRPATTREHNAEERADSRERHPGSQHNLVSQSPPLPARVRECTQTLSELRRQASGTRYPQCHTRSGRPGLPQRRPAEHGCW